MIRWLEKVDDFLALIERLLLIFLTGVLALILMTQVVLRYGFSRPLFWAEEISVQLLVFITLIGFSLLLKRRQMIAIDLIISYIPAKMRHTISILFDFIGLAVILYFAYYSTTWILRPAVRMELSPTTQLPIWINYSVLPLTLYCMAYHQLVGAAKYLVSFKGEQAQ